MSRLKIGVVTCSDSPHGGRLNIYRNTDKAEKWKNLKSQTVVCLNFRPRIPHLIASVRLCGVLKVWVWTSWTIAAREDDPRYVKTHILWPKHPTTQLNTYTQMLPVKLMWGHRCGLHITATTAIFKTHRSIFRHNSTTNWTQQTCLSF